ncbi:MAG TPA: CBS domain-containing protein [Noviherbaspirillum sp.]
MRQPLNVGEICSRTVAFVTEDMSLKEAANRMRTEHVGSLVVVREVPAGRVVAGMLTDRDIAIIAVARDFDPQTLRVAEVMTPDVVTVEPAVSVYEALATMRQKGVRRLPVVRNDNVLEGIVSMDDILEVVAEELQMVVQAMARERSKETRVRV